MITAPLSDVVCVSVLVVPKPPPVLVLFPNFPELEVTLETNPGVSKSLVFNQSFPKS